MSGPVATGEAVGLDRFGGTEVLKVITRPVEAPGPGELLVAVEAAGVNPTDALLRSGQQAAAMSELSPPYVPGMEFAGRVVGLGDGVDPSWSGARVMGLVNPRRPQGGAQADFLRVPVASVVHVPGEVETLVAAAVPMNGVTALKAMDALEVGPEGSVLVTGATGALGRFVCAIAAVRGLCVVAGAREADVALLRELGVSVVVPRDVGMAAAVRALHPGGVDGVIDAALLGETVWALVRDGGTCVSVRGPQGAGDTRVRHVAVSVTQHTEDTQALREVASLLADGVFAPRVGHVLDWAHAAHAHWLLERGGLRERVVLVPAQS